MKTLRQKSIEIILENQSAYGSYIASPNFPTYAYSWFRDGTYIAYAMNRVGQHESAKQFYQWCAQVITRQTKKIEQLISKHQAGQTITAEEALTARYTLDGYPTGDDWTDFQLDGYGTWLWGVSEHLRLTDDFDFLASIKDAIKLTVEYLAQFWNNACYDCWEEHLDYLHTYTLGSILNGLNSILPFSSEVAIDVEQLSGTITAIRSYIEQELVHPNGYYQKMVDPHQASQTATLVDASLLGLFMPIQLHTFDHPLMQNTLRKIEKDLYAPTGGVYRYLEDEYYGGGEWILLSAWLGWVYVQNGDIQKAKTIRTYIKSKQTKEGYLAEQISENVLLPERLQPWIEKWGPVASPLLWSHAMYLILDEEINKNEY